MKRVYLFFREVKHQVFTSIFGFSSTCCHSPSCSVYTRNEIQKNGVIKGGIKGLKRVISCVVY